MNDYYEPEAPYQSHSDTSLEAAESMESSIGRLRLRVLHFIRECGEHGATDDEMQVKLNMNPSTQRPRRIELWRAGWIRDAGFRRQTRSGRLAVVWVEKEDAAAIARSTG